MNTMTMYVQVQQVVLARCIWISFFGVQNKEHSTGKEACYLFSLARPQTLSKRQNLFVT